MRPSMLIVQGGSPMSPNQGLPWRFRECQVVYTSVAVGISPSPPLPLAEETVRLAPLLPDGESVVVERERNDDIGVVGVACVGRSSLPFTASAASASAAVGAVEAAAEP